MRIQIFFIVLGGAFLLSASPGWVFCEPLTEEGAVAAALSLPEYEVLQEKFVARAEADAFGEMMWENPILSYEHQRLFDPDQGGGQDVLMVSQLFDLSNTRADRAGSARAQGEAARSGVEQRHILLEMEVRERFFDVLYAQSRVQMHEQWQRALGVALGVVEARERAGDASRYERMRLESEQARAQLHIQQEITIRDSAWDRLCAVTRELGVRPDVWPRVQGHILPDVSAVEDAEALDTAIQELPAMRALDAQARAAEYDARAADRAWIPWLEVGAGYLHQGVGPLDLHGFAVTVAMPLPFINQQQDEAQRAAAQTDITHSERVLLQHQIRRDMDALRKEVVRRHHLATQAESLHAQAAALVTIAESAYAGDELRLIELLEVHRHQLDVILDVLTLSWEIRRIELKMRRLIATGEAP